MAKAENTIIAIWMGIHVNLTFALSFVFLHELHVHTMQIILCEADALRMQIMQNWEKILQKSG